MSNVENEFQILPSGEDKFLKVTLGDSEDRQVALIPLDSFNQRKEMSYLTDYLNTFATIINMPALQGLDEKNQQIGIHHRKELKQLYETITEMGHDIIVYLNAPKPGDSEPDIEVTTYMISVKDLLDWLNPDVNPDISAADKEHFNLLWATAAKLLGRSE